MFSTLSPQSAGVFLKIGYESGKFRARRKRTFITFKEGAHFTGNIKGPANTSSNRNSVETLAGFDL